MVMTGNRVVEWATKWCIWTKVLVEWYFLGVHIVVSQDHTRRLGQYLRARREELGLSARAVARAVGVRDSTILRLEAGVYGAPAADKLARIAEQLKLDLADVFALANYVVPTSLSSLPHYLSLRYPTLTPQAIVALENLLIQEGGQSTSHLEPTAGGR
jgi:transcriptional regulator with XRE-family HTH domain